MRNLARITTALTLCAAPAAAIAQFGGFGAGQSLPTNTVSRSIPFLGDVDGDGDIDAVCTIENALQVLLNDGSAGFTALPASNGLSSVTLTLELGDFNGDGDLDLARSIGSGGNGTIEILLGDGTGVFTSLPPFAAPPSNNNNRHLQAAELTGDGLLDLVVVNATNGAYILPGNGDGTFAAPLSLALTQFLIGLDISDVDGDGDLDAVFVGSNPIAYVYLNDGAGNFSFSQSLPTPTNANRDIELADVNGDEKPDLISWATTASNAVSVWLNDGAGVFGARADFSRPGASASSDPPHALEVVDMDGDGDRDILCMGKIPDVHVFLNDGNGSFGSETAWPVGLTAFTATFLTLRAGDLDGNGSADVVTGSVLSPVQSGTARFALNLTPTLPPSSVSLVSPPDDLGPVPLPEQLVWPGLPAPILDWTAAEGFGITYTVTIARDPALTNIAFQQSGITGTQLPVPSGLQQGRNYYWSVTANNPIGDTISTPVERRFFTRFGTDVDADGDVDFTDLNTLLTDFGSTTEE